MAESMRGTRGSSPLTRGKRPRRTHGHRRNRLIPAHAGKTHGEHFGGGLIEGSSPLTRGKRRSIAGAESDRGLIPAHAGKTVILRSQEGNRRAHPRSRGENDPGSTQPERLMGSSPLTRGKPARADTRRAPTGLIPAHAGKTSGSAWDARSPGLIPAHAGKTSGRGPVRHPDQAHPRSRGENGHRLPRPRVLPGSSPLTRGKRPKRRGRPPA